MSLALLTLGELTEGFQRYESRWLVPDHDPARDGACVLDPHEVAGRSVLILPEQGRGDILQFSRYAPLLAHRGARVSIMVYDDLRPLLAEMDGMEFVGPDEDEPPCDLVTPAGSLPLAFGTTLVTIPSEVPYLRAPRGHLQTWRNQLGPRACPRVGLAWWGLQHIPYRSMPVSLLAPLLAVPGVEFHALQKDINDGDRGWLSHHGGMVAHAPLLRDFADTAALISQLDLVITIDTSVAHLAGALGMPVWIMLPFSADWRWLTGRDDSPWYPTARLFRQTRRGDWPGVIERVTEALAAHSFRLAPAQHRT